VTALAWLVLFVCVVAGAMLLSEAVT